MAQSGYSLGEGYNLTRLLNCQVAVVYFSQLPVKALLFSRILQQVIIQSLLRITMEMRLPEM